MSREIDNIRNQMKKFYDDGTIKCERGFMEELDKLAVEAGVLIDRQDRNRAYLALHKYWELAGHVMVIGKDPKTDKLYLEIWGMILRYRSW